MSQTLHTYKTKLVLLFVLTYFVGIFHQPLFEAWHFLSHLDDICAGTYQHHSHDNSISEEDHQHIAIDTAVSMFDSGQDQEQPISNKNQVKTQDLKQVCSNINEVNLTQFGCIVPPYSKIDKLKSRYQPTHSPPPRV